MSTALAEKRSISSTRPLGRALREHALRILAGSYDFIDSPTFRQRGIETRLMYTGAEATLPPISWYHPTTESSAGGGLAGAPNHMDGEEEKLTFYRYNYAKKRLTRLQRMVRRGTLTAEIAGQLVQWHRRYEHLREYLVRTNLALVLAMARRMRLGQLDFAEVVSEGNLALLRTVDKFDADRGFKFSTYACRSILQAFGRASIKLAKHRTRFPIELELTLEKSDWPEQRRGIFERECVDELKLVVDGNLANLSEIETTVIRQRFNWQEQAETPLTLEEVGKIVGVTKERVRQIQNAALAKIRQIIEQRIWGAAPLSSKQHQSSRFPVVHRIQTGTMQQA